MTRNPAIKSRRKFKKNICSTRLAQHTLMVDTLYYSHDIKKYKDNVDI